MEMLMEMNEHSTLILVTHNPDLARMSDREIRLRDGRIDKRITHRKRGSIQKSNSRK
jgi:ABC-type lipoprotein export system ATPase subunit